MMGTQDEDRAGLVTEGEVPGDRGIPSVNRAKSLQARVSNGLAIGLMSVIGVGLLTWYYVQAFSRTARTSTGPQAAVKQRADSEMVLPALGRIDPPAPSVIERVMGPAPALPSEVGSAPELSPESSFMPESSVGADGAGRSAGGTMKSSAERLLERQLGGPSLVIAATGETSRQRSMPADERGRLAEAASPSEQGDLSAWLQPTVTPAVSAAVLPTRQLLLPKGSFVDCTLETALDSTLPGMATCVTAADTFSADGKVVLLERGARLIGETRGSVRQGAARIFVLWTEARIGDVVVPLASPGTDELGRSGLPGEVDRHFFERFGAAILVSVIDGAVQAAVQSSMKSAGNGSTVIYNPSTSQDILTEVLRSTITIPPTVRKAQGDRVQVFVARDVDFRSVYRLRALDGSSR